MLLHAPLMVLLYAGAPPCTTHGAPLCRCSSMHHSWCSSMQVLLHASSKVLPHAILSVLHHTVTLLNKYLGSQAKVSASGNKGPHLFSSVLGVSVPHSGSAISKTSSLSIRFPGCIPASGDWQAGRGLWARLRTPNGDGVSDPDSSHTD